MEDDKFGPIRNILHAMHRQLESIPDDSDAMCEGEEWAVGVDRSSCAPPDFQRFRFTYADMWTKLKEWYDNILRLYSECGLLNVYEDEFWSTAMECLRSAGLHDEVEKCSSLLQKFRPPVRKGTIHTDLLIPRSGNIVQVNSNSPVLFVFRGVEDEKKLSRVKEVMTREWNINSASSKSYLHPISGSHFDGKNGVYAIEMAKGEELLEQFLENEHDIPLDHRMKMGMDVFNGTKELMGLLKDYPLISNGISCQCFIVVNAEKWRHNILRGERSVCPKLKVVLPLPFMEEGTDFDRLHVNHGISCVLFEIMSVQPWKNASVSPMKNPTIWKIVPESDFPSHLRTVIECLERMRELNLDVVQSYYRTWKSFDPDCFRPLTSLALKALKVATEKDKDETTNESDEIGAVLYEDGKFHHPMISRHHPMSFVLEAMNEPVVSFKKDCSLKKFCELMGRTGFVIPNVMLLLANVPPPLLHFVANDRVMEIGHPLMYVGIAHVDCIEPKPTFFVPPSVLYFMHAYVESLKCDRLKIKSPFECLFPPYLPNYREMADSCGNKFRQYCLRWLII
eukprot:TRINITY_DN81070_c0_g1_i1.p1 TRINITY_DN81070_c0_g1~~TRINITY_DN81070_c0_g1_i1.p1  ORF type:complete len:565 (+),score=133.95 TRINITY_DN81070_c0_g1_i1:92-1786(+)